MSKLVIVESPAKAKNIKGYLGRGYCLNGPRQGFAGSKAQC